jgi:DNA-binding MarR family transcriptional regulator
MRASPHAALYSMLARDDDAKALHITHLLLLGAICAQSRPLTLAWAADLIGVSYEQTTRLARRLIEAGFLLRQWDPDDARKHVVSPTSEGKALDARVRDYIATSTGANMLPLQTEEVT